MCVPFFPLLRKEKKPQHFIRKKAAIMSIKGQNQWTFGTCSVTRLSSYLWKVMNDAHGPKRQEQNLQYGIQNRLSQFLRSLIWSTHFVTSPPENPEALIDELDIRQKSLWVGWKKQKKRQHEKHHTIGYKIKLLFCQKLQLTYSLWIMSTLSKQHRANSVPKSTNNLK